MKKKNLKMTKNREKYIFYNKKENTSKTLGFVT